MDGRGAGRQRIYEKMGFSKAKPGSSIFAVKQADGSMAPGKTGSKGSLSWTNQRFDKDALWFEEEEDTLEMWRQIIFGADEED